MLHGHDVSAYQSATYTPPASDAFLFVKASEGTGWVSPRHDSQVSVGRARGLVIGHYHFLHHGSITAQAQHFVASSKLKKGDVLIIDWEQPGGAVAATASEVKTFAAKLRTLAPGHRVLVYLNQSFRAGLGDTKIGDGYWVAAPGAASIPTSSHLLFWQYHFGELPDRYGNDPVDCNWAKFASKAALVKWAGGSDTATEKAPVTTTTKTVPVHPTRDAIHTGYGVKGPYWSKGYHQGDDWHRNAGAAEIGDPIVAVADGTVIYAGDARTDGGGGWGPAFGKHVLIQWDEHGRTSIDAHMNKVTAKHGQRVKAGDKIGEKGMTGNVTGPHDHHEQHLGTRWTDKDVKPIYPGKKTTVAVAKKTEGVPVMAKPKKWRSGKAISYKKGSGWHMLPLDDDRKSYSMASGPGTIYATVDLTTTGSCRAQFRTVNKSKAGKVVNATVYDAVHLEPGGNQLTFFDTIGGPAKGFDQKYVRLYIWPETDVTVKKSRTRAAKES